MVNIMVMLDCVTFFILRCVITILIVENSESFAYVLQLIIENFNESNKVYIASTLEDADNLIKVFDFDLLLVDYYMENHITSCKFVKKYHDPYKIVIMTGANISIENLQNETGVMRIIKKPFGIEVLERLLK